MKGHKTMDTQVQNGVEAIGPAEYAIIINGQRVDVAYGDRLEAGETYREWLEAIEAGSVTLESLEIPLVDLPDDYFKNGHLERLEIPFKGEPVTIDEAANYPESLGLSKGIDY